MATRPDRGEILQRIDQATTEIRYVKDQQFKTLYYSLLFFSAIVALFQIHVYFSRPLFVLIKVLSIIIVAIFCRVSSQLQWDHFKALGEYREGLDKLESSLRNYILQTPVSPTKRSNCTDWILFLLFGKERPDAKVIVTSKDKLPSSKRYTWTFVGLTVLAALSTIVVLIFDK
jgi:hypothetical protein